MGTLRILEVCTYIVLIYLTNAQGKDDVTDKPEVGLQSVTAHLCPFICTVGMQIFCSPPPCPPPACVDPARHKPTDCCVYCPHGPNCRGPDGSVIQYQHWKIVDGQNCTCLSPSMKATCNS